MVSNSNYWSLVVGLLFIIIICVIHVNVKNNMIGGLRFTRNMSYDLRGDPCIIRPAQFAWNNSSWAPMVAFNNPGVPYCDQLPNY